MPVEKEPVIKTMKISKSFSRKISTSQYENCTVFVSAEREIEYKDVEDLWKKSGDLGKFMMEDYQRSEQEFMQTAGMVEVNSSKNAPKNIRPFTEKEKKDFDVLS